MGLLQITNDRILVLYRWLLLYVGKTDNESTYNMSHVYSVWTLVAQYQVVSAAEVMNECSAQDDMGSWTIKFAENE
jgi:hypothetical protein